MMAWPPSWLMPTSNDTRVLVDGFSNTIAKCLPAKGAYGVPFRVKDLMRLALSKIALKSSAETSLMSKK